MIDADVARERWGAPSRRCHCGRMDTGRGFTACILCWQDSAAAFWDFREGRISEPAFYRRLRRTSPKWVTRTNKDMALMRGKISRGEIGK